MFNHATHILALCVGWSIGSILAVVGLLTGTSGTILTWMHRAGGAMSISTADLYRGCAVVRLDKCDMLGRTWEPGWYAFGAPIPIPLHEAPFATEHECKAFVHTTMK